MQKSGQQELSIEHTVDVSIARRMAKATAVSAGFGDTECEEIALVASELASNLVRHAKNGKLIFLQINDGVG